MNTLESLLRMTVKGETGCLKSKACLVKLM
jgi:hypothetical protein